MSILRTMVWRQQFRITPEVPIEGGGRRARMTEAFDYRDAPAVTRDPNTSLGSVAGTAPSLTLPPQTGRGDRNLITEPQIACSKFVGIHQGTG